MKNKEKYYEFSVKGLNKAIADGKQDKINNVVNIGFWGVMLGLGVVGIINIDKMVSIVACTGTSKVVKYLMR